MIKQLKHLATTLIIIIEMWLYVTVFNELYLNLPYILGVLEFPILMIIVLASLLFANRLINGKGSYVAKIISTVIEWGIALLLFITILLLSERWFFEAEDAMGMFVGLGFLTIVSVGAIIYYFVRFVHEIIKTSKNTSP